MFVLSVSIKCNINIGQPFINAKNNRKYKVVWGEKNQVYNPVILHRFHCTVKISYRYTSRSACLKATVPLCPTC